MSDNLELILSEIQTLRTGGCMIGAANKTKVDRIEQDFVQHDKRINKIEQDNSIFSTKLDAIPDQVTTQVATVMDNKINGGLKAQRTMITIPGIPFKIPATWVGWAAITFAMWFIWYSHSHGISETMKVLHAVKAEVQEVQNTQNGNTDG